VHLPMLTILADAWRIHYQCRYTMPSHGLRSLTSDQGYQGYNTSHLACTDSGLGTLVRSVWRDCSSWTHRGYLADEFGFVKIHASIHACFMILHTGLHHVFITLIASVHAFSIANPATLRSMSGNDMRTLLAVHNLKSAFVLDEPSRAVTEV
jgi:hypothetical protein